MKTLEAKAVVLGSQAVGKTSVVMRCVRDMFDCKIGPTIGAAFFTYKMHINEYRVNLQIWDTAGQERFKSMAPMYYRKASIAILVYDITDEDSFSALKNWVFGLILFGNKCDRENERAVQTKEASDYAESIGARHVEVSALTSDGIQEGFVIVGEMVIEQLESQLPTYAHILGSDTTGNTDELTLTPPSLDDDSTDDTRQRTSNSRCPC